MQLSETAYLSDHAFYQCPNWIY